MWPCGGGLRAVQPALAPSKAAPTSFGKVEYKEVVGTRDVIETGDGKTKDVVDM